MFAAIDLVGGLLFGLARVIRNVASGMRPQQQALPPDDPRTILILQLDHLGDAILTTAMLPALRHRYPQASIEVLVAPWNREFFEAVPEVDCVHVCGASRFARSGGWAWLPATFYWGWKMRRRRVELAIDVRGEFPHALLLWLSGAGQRLGWRSGGGGFFLTHSPRYLPGRHEVESRQALLEELGVAVLDLDEVNRVACARPSGNWEEPRGLPPAASRGRPDLLVRGDPSDSLPPAASRGRPLRVGRNRRLESPPTISNSPTASACPGVLLPTFQPTAEARQSIAARLTTLSQTSHCTGPLLVAHISAGTPAKQWPPEHWRACIGRILVQLDAQVILVGAPEDRHLADEILEGRPWPGVANWTGQFGIIELAALLERADLFVGPDSGPAHLAAAVGTAAVVLFSGTNSPQQWRPLGPNVTVLRHAVPCSPCHRERCPLASHRCMSQLLPERVARVAETQYKNTCRGSRQWPAAEEASLLTTGRQGRQPNGATAPLVEPAPVGRWNSCLESKKSGDSGTVRSAGRR